MTATSAQKAAEITAIANAQAIAKQMAPGSTVNALTKTLATAAQQAAAITVVNPPPPPPPANPIKVTSALTFTGVGSTAAPFTASLRATSSAGVISWIFPSWTLPAGWSWSGNLDIVCTAAGSIDVPGVIVQDTAGNKVTVEVKVTVTAPVVPPPPPPPPPTGMAIGVSLGNAQALWGLADHGAAQYAAMHADGFHGVRIDCPMNNPGANDATIRAAIAAGLDVLLILDGYQTQNGPAAFAAFASATVKEYAPLGIHHYELLNEPGSATNWDTQDNFVNPAAYAALCKQAYTAIKAADAASVVVLGGNSVFQSSNGAGPDANGNYVGSLLPATFLTAVYAANGGTTAGLCDAIGIHPYCDPNLPAVNNNWGVFLNPVGTAGFYGDSVCAVMSAHGEAKKPVWITEFGFQTASVQAAGFTAALNQATAGPAVVAAFYCFNWSDDGDGAYGLNTSAYTQKPALVAVEKFLQGAPGPPPPAPAGSKLYMGGWTGTASTVAAFLSSLGLDPAKGCAQDFIWTPDWPTAAKTIGFIDLATFPGFKFLGECLQVTASPRNWQDVISGSQDAMFKANAAYAAKSNMGMRLAWEFNGGWFPYGVGGFDSPTTQQLFVQAWRHVASIYRAANPNCQTVFNPTDGLSAYMADWTLYYPGDDLVSIIATDVYDKEWNTPTWPGDAAWEQTLASKPPSPDDVAAFAAAHGKDLAIMELGTWNPNNQPNQDDSPGDDPGFVTFQMNWLLKQVQSGHFKNVYGLWWLDPSFVQGIITSFPNSMAALKSWVATNKATAGLS